jgi:hypothetical protein
MSERSRGGRERHRWAKPRGRSGREHLSQCGQRASFKRFEAVADCGLVDSLFGSHLINDLIPLFAGRGRPGSIECIDDDCGDSLPSGCLDLWDRLYH